MFRKVACFVALLVGITNAAIIIKEDYSTEGSDVAPQTINDISFGNLVSTDLSDFTKSDEELAADNVVLSQSTKSSETEGSSEEIAFPSFPDFEFDLNIGSAGDGQNYYYQGDDDDDDEYYYDDLWEDLEEPTEIVFPAPDEGEEDGTGDSIVVEFPGFGSIFRSSPPVRSGSPGSSPASDSNGNSHPASEASLNSAVNSMFSTPHSDRYQDRAYEAMTEVRTNCKADFEQMCTPRTLDSFLGNGIFSLLSSAVLGPMFSAQEFSFAPRTRRLFISEPQDHLSFLTKLKGHMERVKNELGGVAVDMKPQLDKMASNFAHFRNDLKKLQVNSPEGHGGPFREGTVPGDIVGPRDPKIVPIDSPSKYLQQGEMKIRSPVSTLRTNQRVRDRHLAEGVPQMLRGKKINIGPKEHLESGGPQPCHHDHSDHPPLASHSGDGDFEWESDHPWEVSQDASYNGELLWGPMGDRCMYENFDDLSEQCQDSILNVYSIREQYMDEEEGKPNRAFWIFVFIVCIMLVYAKRQRRLAKYEKELAMYNAMEANPELKAQIEKASGVVMEKPQRCKFYGCGFFFLKVVLSILCALLAIQIAVFMTVIVYENNIVEDEYGNEQLPPPILPFISFMIFLLAASFFMSFLFSKCFQKKQRRERQGGETVVAAESPSTSTSPSTWSMPSLSLPAWMSRPSSNDYAVLSGESVHGNAAGSEMVVITPSAPAPRAVVVQHNYPSTAAVVSPMNII